MSLELTLGELEKDVGTENKDKEREDEEKDKEAGSGEEMEDEDQGDKEHVGHFTSGKRESLQCHQAMTLTNWCPNKGGDGEICKIHSPD